MTFEEYVQATHFYDQREIVAKVRILAFYKLQRDKQTVFSVKDVAQWLRDLDLPEPNGARLRAQLQESSDFIKANGVFKLHANVVRAMRDQHPRLADKSEEVVSLDSILPGPLYESTRGFIESLAKQINSSYEHNIFDGAAVLMRRLLEVLLILAYQHQGRDSAIKDHTGNYVMLEKIIADAKTNADLGLSRNTRSHLDDFRNLGNFSAHKIHYNARRDDIKRLILEYRAAIEELLYKAGIRK